jgi:sphingomyelin phosphodiesterase acid-like 3
MPRKPTWLVVIVLMLATFRVADAAPWLLVTDIHLRAGRDGSRPAPYGADTNAVLFASALAEMHAVDPDPPVVVFGGDLLDHSISRQNATPVAVAIARAFNRVYPHAQFVFTLGNEDSNCGDYGVAPNSAFLRAVARAWEPLVNRNHAAPHFMQTFPRDGFYTASLPVRGTRAVVVNDVFWSPRYHSGCGPARGASATRLAELKRALSPATGRSWVFLHIPPGIDAFSTTHLTHRLAVVPFLDPVPRAGLIALIGDPSKRVGLVFAAHTHKFAYRIVNASGPHPVPILLVPAISPIFGNAPSFLTANVSPDGIVSGVEEISYLHGRWQDDGGLHSLGVSEVNAGELRALQARLAEDRKLRERFAALYNGDAPPEINEANWRSYWCAATAFAATDFRACTQQGGYSIFTERGIVLGAGAVAVLLLVAAGAVIGVVLLRRRPRRGA